MYFECKFLNLPKIPKELIENIAPGNLIRNYPGREYTRNGATLISAPSPFYTVSAELEKWIQDNICRDYNEVGVRYTYGGPKSPSTVVHTDETRTYVLMYNLDSGSGRLNFWQEWGNRVVREGRHLITDYSKIIRVGQHETPNFEWYIIDARILHSVESLKSTRINIQVSLNHDFQPH